MPPMREHARTVEKVSRACWWPRCMQLNVTLFLSLPVAYMVGRSILYSFRAAPTLKERVTSMKDAPMTLTRMTKP